MRLFLSLNNAWLGDYPHSRSIADDHFGATLKRAIVRFQWRHGLRTNGVIGMKTIRQLNITPEERLQQLKTNMHRWAEFPDGVGSHYIRVNVASFDLNVIKDGDTVLSMKVVAGKPKRPTPTLYSKIETLQFNPHWNIPRGIARKDIIPRTIKNPAYLEENNIKLYSNWKKDAYEIDPATVDWEKIRTGHIPFRMTQIPGPDNALGRVKFIFLNEHDIYLHDTPQKGLFSKIQRAYSSGCVRLEKPFHLVEYFIKNNPELDTEKMNRALSTGETKYIRIQNPLPIYVTYITAWVDKQGTTHFREDIYKRD